MLYSEYSLKRQEVICISFFSALFNVLSASLLYLWNFFLYWLSIFAAPLKGPEMFWIIIPIWINWFFTEFFMEKYGTSLGNAVSNGVIPILAGLDWLRYTFHELGFGLIVFTKVSLSVATILYGIFVIIAGIRLKNITFYIGRIRWITYVLVTITPVIYNVIDFDFKTLLALILFFPLYWWVIEIFDRITPEPRLYREDS